jgi:hypothetical protein
MFVVVTEAIAKAKRIGQTDNDGAALALICADFHGVPEESFA